MEKEINTDIESEQVELESEIEEEENYEVQEHPFSTKNIKVTSAPLLITHIVNRLKHNEIDLVPDFQRSSDLWNRKKMSRLIESIILRLPLPIFYFDVSYPDKWVVIDGLQRLSTIKRFIVEDDLKLGHLEFLKDLENKKFSELERSYQRIIEETQLLTYQVEAQTPKEVKYSIFNRVNTGGLSLNPQEVRQALNQEANGVKILKEIVELEEFKTIVNLKSKRMTDRELVLRFIAFKAIDYKPNQEVKYPLSILLDKTMEEIDNPKNTINSLRKYKDSLKETLVFLDELLDRKVVFNKTLADSSKTKTLNRSLFEVWTVLCSNLTNHEKQKMLNNKDHIKIRYKTLLSNPQFNDAITKGTNDRKMVKERFRMFGDFLQEVLKEC